MAFIRAADHTECMEVRQCQQPGCDGIYTVDHGRNLVELTCSVCEHRETWEYDDWARHADPVEG
jgi:hypothetical protein